MDEIHLDFLHPQRRNGALAWLLLGFGLAAVLAALGWNRLIQMPDLAMHATELHGLNSALAERRPPVASNSNEKQLAQEWVRAINVAGELNQPWDDLFEALEKNAKRPVALLKLESDAAKQDLSLTAEARNFEAMLAYYRYLQSQHMLRAVVLHAHQVNQQDRERPINFQITAKWVSRP